MPSLPPPLGADPTLPFKYVGGHPAVDLVNTVDWTSRGQVGERLTDYVRLTEWAEGAGVISRPEGDLLRLRAATHRAEARAAYERACGLRGTLQRIFGAIATGRAAGAALDEFNAALAAALAHLRVAAAGAAGAGDARSVPMPLAWAWSDFGARLDGVLWPVTWAAATLLTSDDAGRLRVCGGPDCGWMYVDRSRNGLRRWCEMETCGTREKSRRRQLRARTSPHSARSR